MSRRLIDRYPLGSRVTVLLADGVWYPGVVVEHNHPAIWVRADAGHIWFVTNGRRLRAAKDENET